MSRLKFSISIFFLFVLQSVCSQNDCSNALIICGNNNYADLSATGAGIQELSGSNSCASAENNSLWLKVNILTGGTLGFILTPTSNNITVDFDFFVFGPNATCGNIGQAIRCSTTNPEAAGSTSNMTGMNATEFDLSEGPGISGNNFVKWLTVLDNETYFIVIDRPIGTSNFSLAWTGSATFNQPPVFNNTTAGTTLNIEKCDSDASQDNKTIFDLTTSSAIAIGSQSGTTPTFHTSSNDVVTGENPIVNPNSFQNTTNPQQIYLRLTNNITGCFSTASFNVTVTPFVTPDPINLTGCDLDNNGFVTFNLTDNDANLINGNSNTVVSYHPTDNDTAILPSIYTNQLPFTNETLWAKIRNTSTGCFTYKPFDIIIKTIPNATPSQLTQCDFGLFPDGLTTFNLAEANPDLTGNDSNLSTKFYINPIAAQNDTGVLNTNYLNITNPQTISVRVIDNTTGCYTITTLTLNVTTNPTVTIVLEHCDDDATEDGFFEFNLADAGFETTGNTVTYFENLNDALIEQNPIAASFTNTTINQQTVYARIENNNACSGINVINLFVRSLPNIEITDTAIFCLNTPNTPTILDAGLISGNPNTLQYLWSPNGETTPTISVLAAGQYSVRVSNNFGCFKDRIITVSNSDLATIENIAIIDLSDNNTVTIFVIGDENQFEYSIDLPYGPFQNSNQFENVEAGIHTIYIADKEGCGIISKEISVVGIPKFFTPNADGYNDTWKIIGLTQKFYSNSTIHIYDRYGKLLKQINPIGDGWDGIYNGNMLPGNDYWYAIYLEDGRIVKGHFALKR
ncbi:T9SS type B sorting domain-containing protein [Flavobacterium sp.]|uniref:T9SS type B sorting domain-containing protein n=1 Tax=Flavobacterium sp. TaxID=239 RepID=UPI002B4B7C62|nr:T9SS type B sorting domain-containing protein [Flavobacterium sp.]HLF52016.1 T9SS type B sorting domain-containing protein [Flavobacterium sp.]